MRKEEQNMKKARVSAKWKEIATNDIAFGDLETKAEKIRREHRFNKAIKTMRSDKPIYNEKEGTSFPINLIKEGNVEADKRDARKANLIEAYEAKKLKSKTLIKEAKSYVKKFTNKTKTA